MTKKMERPDKVNVLNRFEIFVHPPGELICDYLRRDGVWEPEATKVSNVVFSQANNNSLFLDVGANIGYFSLLAASWGVKTISIEPVDGNLDLFNRSLQLQPALAEHITIIKKAVSSSEGSIQMSYYAHNMGLSRFSEGTTWGSQGTKVTVPMTTLDVMLQEGILGTEGDIIAKIDVEESELSVSQGMTTLLKSGRIKYMFIEISPTENRYSGLEVCERLRILAGLNQFNLVERINPEQWQSMSENDYLQALGSRRQLNFVFWK